MFISFYAILNVLYNDTFFLYNFLRFVTTNIKIKEKIHVEKGYFNVVFHKYIYFRIVESNKGMKTTTTTKTSIVCSLMSESQMLFQYAQTYLVTMLFYFCYFFCVYSSTFTFLLLERVSFLCSDSIAVEKVFFSAPTRR